MRYVIVLLLMVWSQHQGWTQSSSNSIYLHGPVPAAPAKAASPIWDTAWPDNNCGPGGCYAIIQFTAMPQKPERASLAELGIELLDYIPDRAFLAFYTGSEPLRLPYYVERILPLEGKHKRADTPADGGEYELLAIPFPTVAPVALAEALTQEGAVITSTNATNLEIRVAAEKLEHILSCPLLYFVEPLRGAPVAEGLTAAENIRVTDLRTQSGLLLDGQGVALGIQDDGALDHIDFQGRYHDLAFVDTGNHGDMVAGMAAGGGWLNPIGRGAAPGAEVYMFYLNDDLLLTQAAENYHRYGIGITNTSYGFECGAGYTSAARDLDNEVYQLPALLPGFSAGNQGEYSCGNRYGLLGSTPEGTFWGNITGAQKSAKNVVAVGNVSWDDRVLSFSSRGPTPSGRIKPDLVAQGQGDWTTDRNNGYRISGGTSAAAPSAMGGFAVLYQGYRQLHGGQDPSSALIKALVLNTADDIGLPGPDYRSGWGRMNTAKAWECLENGNYFTGTISHGQTQTFTLPVPANTKRLRVMIYWHDAPASVLASRDLVNDLDLRLFAPAGQGRLPWAPSTVAHLDSLNQAAQPRVDRVNNVEQVVWEDPAAGNFTIEVRGHQVPSASQDYYLVYYFETEPLAWVSPAAGDALVPEESVVLSWEALQSSAPFRVEYSLDGGQAWELVAANIPADRRSIRWQVPPGPTTQLQFRVVRDAAEARSAGVSLIAPQVNFTVLGRDEESAIVSWEAVDGAVAYDVFQLIGSAMVPLERLSSLSYTVPVENGESYWFSVAPVFAGDLVGRRAIAQNYVHTSCTRQVRLQLQFDAYPAQTSWRILDAGGNTLESGGPYVSAEPHSYRELSFCLPEGCHTLVMQDEAGDGMCCANGDGYYRMLGAQGTVLLEGGAFGNFRPQIFCPEEGTLSDPLTANLEIVRAISCAGQSDGQLRVTVEGGTGDYHYLWSTGESGPELQTAAAGDYTVTVHDGADTLVLATALVEPAPLTLQAVTTSSLCQDGTLRATVAGGTPPYALQWNTGQQEASLLNLAPGTYAGTVSDANNCLTSGRFIVEEVAPLALQLTTVQPTCAAPAGGEISAQLSGGRGNVSWLWSTGDEGSPILTGLSEGDYALTVVDGACQQTATTQLQSPVELTLHVTNLSPSCAEGTDGLLAVEVATGTAPFTYLWEDGAEGPLRSDLPAGTYRVTVGDAGGCQAQTTQNLVAPEALVLNAVVSPAVGEAGGSIEVEISGGTPPYTVLWEGSASTDNPRTDLEPGVYSLTVVDDAGCSAFLTVEVPRVDPTDMPEYCAMRGVNTNYEWIAGLALDGTDYDNGNDGGYGDYRHVVLPLTQGGIHDMTLKPGYRFTSYREVWRAWIDWNKDGDFTDFNEMVIADGPAIGNVLTNLVVPEDVPPGQYRLRIAMQYGLPATPCANITYGEVEDYTVEVSSPQQARRIGGGSAYQPAGQPWGMPDSELRTRLWPNPVADRARVVVENITSPVLRYQLTDSQGRVLLDQQLATSTPQLEFELLLQSYPRGVYFLYLQSGTTQQVRRLVKK